MTTPTIPNGETQFFPIIYEGNGAGQRVGKFVPFTDSGTIAHSVMFNDDDDAYLARTFSTPTNNKKWTYSVWIKRGNLGTNQAIMSADYEGASYWDMRFNTSDQILIQNRIGSSNILLANTTRTFEDTSKWYHLVFVYDSDNSTSTSRAILYIDGDIQTLSAYPSSGDASAYNVNSEPHHIGVSRTSDTSGGIWSEFDGYFAEANFVDGQALTPASFGEINTSTGRWVPSTVTPYPTTTTSYAVTVVGGNPSNHPYHNVGSTNKFAIDGSTATANVTLNLVEGATYRFDQSDNSNSGHPLRFSTTANGTHGGGSEYTTGVTTNGTPGSSGAYTEITVASGAPTLYYYCTNHSAMGWTANTPAPYGTNGFRLQFGTASALGDDTSGLTNDFTATNLATTDQTTDSPTQLFNTMGSFNSSVTKAEGNLKITTPASGGGGGFEQCVGQPAFGVRSGKWYWEVKVNVKGQNGYGWKSDDNTGGSQASDGVSTGYTNYQNGPIYVVGGVGGYADGTWDVNLSTGASEFSAFTTASVNDVIMFALDLDNKKGYVGLNGTWFNSANPANGTGSIGLGRTPVPSANARFYPMCMRLGTTATGTYNFGATSFAHTPPTGFLALGQDNLPEATKGISGLVWTKNRDSSDNQIWMDSSRGAGQRLESAETGAQVLVNNSLNKFLAGGQQIGDYADMNRSGNSFVSWNWVANGGTTVSNTDGSITSTVQVNQTAGFSVVRFTPASAGTVGHGLSTAPEWIIMKDTTRSVLWLIYHKDIGADKYLQFTSAAAVSNSTVFSTEPTATVFDPGTGYTSASSYGATVAYCWHSVEGFSKFGKFIGNGNADGSFIYTGFKPSLVIIKSSSHGNNWIMWDNKRSVINPCDNVLYPDLTQAETTSGNDLDFLSNGFKCRGTNTNYNGSSRTYVYMAFASHPFVGDGTSPVTAR